MLEKECKHFPDQYRIKERQVFKWLKTEKMGGKGRCDWVVLEEYSLLQRLLTNSYHATNKAKLSHTVETKMWIFYS